MSKKDLKKGAEVVVIAGKEKGKRGEILEVLPPKRRKTKAGLLRPSSATAAVRVIVAGVNIAKHHEKKQGNQEAGINEREAALDSAKVALVAGYKGKLSTTEKTEKPAQ
ncbi:MAG: 50S ribosomal protein L24 [Puniceicoccales bacterium]|jgi:large subunit ribosomal protein L24|nr:50S ribosomal protein L24 [Puniceicoccales bacterium]